jgi:hypothetical protein
VLQATLPEPDGIKGWKRKHKNWEDILKYKANMGSIIHYRILNGLSVRTLELPDLTFDDIPKDVDHLYEISTHMFETLNLDIGQPRVIETLHINKTHKYCGTPDMISPISSVGTLVDLKTSSAIYESHMLQMGGYYDMIEPKPKRAMLISIHPYIETNPTLDTHIVEIPEEDVIVNGYVLQEGLKTLRNRFVELVKIFYETVPMPEPSNCVTIKTNGTANTQRILERG